MCGAVTRTRLVLNRYSHKKRNYSSLWVASHAAVFSIGLGPFFQINGTCVIEILFTSVMKFCVLTVPAVGVLH